MRGLSLTLDIWLKSAKPSALLNDPLPKGSSVPNGSGIAPTEPGLQVWDRVGLWEVSGPQ
jgi:hypothetical protein